MKKLCIFTSVITTVLFSINTAHAFVAFNVAAEDINASTTEYNYEINTSCFGFCSDTIGGIPISDLNMTNNFYIPYFSDAGITNISSPTGWSFSIENNNDLFNLGNNAGVLHWSTSPGNELPLDTPLSGFTYSSSITNSVKAPFKIEYSLGGFRIGDPPIPASPLAIAAGLPAITTVPLPASLWLMGVALMSLFRIKKSNYQTGK